MHHRPPLHIILRCADLPKRLGKHRVKFSAERAEVAFTAICELCFLDEDSTSLCITVSLRLRSHSLHSTPVDQLSPSHILQQPLAHHVGGAPECPSCCIGY